MNKELEQKIVEMKFDNSDFEQKVAQSLVTLKQLKESTKMEDAGKGLDNLSKSAKNLDLSHIANGIEQLNARFSNLGVVGMTVMQRLTNAAMDMGQKIGAAITEAPRDGWKEYELNLDSVKTILNSAKTADGLPVTLDQVNQKLAELNAYSDKTIYSFSDMTNNIGKFTNAGVDLDSAVTAIQGVANVAALAGANASDASRAMYNFGQALGSGSVKLIDWKSIENANMATVDFKEQLIQTALELGTVRKEGEKYISTTKNMQGKVSDAFDATQGFNDSLSAQWMTSEVLTKTLAKYTDETTDLGKAALEAATQVTTFSKLIDTLKESMGSGWMQTWQYIFGDFEESKQLWTGIYNELDGIIQKVAGARNEFLKGWKEAGGRDELLGALANIWTTAKYYVDLITKAFATAFPKIDAKPIVAISKGFNAFTEKVKPSVEAMEKLYGKVEDTAEAVTDVAERAEKFNEIVQQIINGDWGNGQERIDRLHEAGYAFENLQNAVNEVLGCEKRYETVMSDNEAVGLSANDVLSENAALLDDQAKGVAAVTDELADQNPIVGNLAKILLGVSSTIKVLKAGVSTVWNTLARGASVLTVVKGALGIILDVLGALGGKLYQFNTWILSFSSVGSFFKGLSAKLLSLEKSLLNSGIYITNLSKVGRVLLSVFTKVKSAIDSFFTTLSSGAKSLNFERLKVGVFEFGRFVAGVLIIALDALASVVVTVYNGLIKLKDTVMGLTVVQKLVANIKKLKTEFTNFKNNLIISSAYLTYFKPVLEQIAITMAHLGRAILPIVSDAFNLLAKVVSTVGNRLDKFYGMLKQSGALDKVSTIFTNFKAAIKDIPELITSLYESIKSGKLPSFNDLPATFKNLIDSLKTFKEFAKVKIDESISKVIEFFFGIFKKLPDGKKLGPFAGFIEKLKKAFEDFRTMAKGAKGSVGIFVSGVIEKLSKIDFRGGAITALIGALGIFVLRWSKVGKSAAKAIKAMGDFIKNGGQVAQTAVDKYNGFLKIAAAIGIIAGSIWLLAQVPADRFREVCIALGVAFVAMAGTILLLSTLKIPEDKIKAIGLAFGGMGVGFLAVAAAAKIIGNMDENELKKGGGALVGFVVMVVAAAKLAGKVGVGAGAAFVGLGVALLLLIPSIIVFSKMDTHTLVKGGAAVFVFMLMIAKAAKVAGDAKGTLGAFLGISLALLLLIPSIKILGTMDPSTLLKGGAAVVALMFMMAHAAKLANGGAKGFAGMAIAIGVITAAMYILSGLPWSSLISSAAALAIVLYTTAKAMSDVGSMKFTEILKGAIGLAAAIGVVCLALVGLNKYGGNADEQLKNALAISAILVAFRIMAPAIEILSKIPFQAGVVAAGNAMVFFGAMVLCLGALGEVSSWGNGAAGDAIVNGANMVGRVIRGFIDGITGADDETEKVDKLGSSLSNFASYIKGFVDGISMVDESTAAAAKNLALAILALCGAELLDAVTAWITGGKDLGAFSESIAPLTKAIVDMNDTLAGKDIDTEKIQQISEVISTFTDLAKNLPSTGGWLQKLVGVKDLGTFATDMKEFMDGGFRGFLSSLNMLDLPITLIGKMAVVKSTTSAMIDLANNLPKNGIISTLIDGTADLGEFAASMAAFLAYDKYGLFVTRVGIVGDADLGKLRGNIIPATQEMINLANKIKSNTSIIDAITGRTNLGKFGETLADFGAGIGKFSDSIANVSTFKMSSVIDSVFRIADLNASDNVKGNALSTFGLSINSLGKSLATFIKDTGEVTSERLADISGGLTNLHNLLLILAASDYSGVGNFIEAMRTLAEMSITEFVESFATNTEAATVAIQGFTAAVTEALTGDPEAVKEKARSIITTFSAEIFAPSGNLMMQASGEHLIDSLIRGVDNYKESELETCAKGVITTFSAEIFAPSGNLMMQASGEHLISSIVAGVTSMLSEITKVALTTVAVYGAGIISKRIVLSSYGRIMASAAYNGANTLTDDFYDLGQDAADGYARGIRSKAQDVADEAREMVSKAIKAAQDEQKSASPSKVYRGLGRDGGEGYALGFGDMVSMVVNSVRSTGHAGILAMQDTISKMRDNIDTGMDFNPVITPVLDLTEMMNGLTAANLMLSDINPDGLTAAAAISIGEQHNAALAQSRKNSQPADYSNDLLSLIDNTRKIIAAVKENRYAILDGESTFDFIDRRIGMA